MVTILRLILSIMFIFSAVSKLISLPFFDSLVAELFLGVNYYEFPESLWYTQALSRILISVELCLGLAVLQNSYLKKLVIPLIQFTLIVFTAHLFYEGLTSPKGFIEGNCGCFGDILPMNNLESILKNVAAIVFGAILYKKFNDDPINPIVPSVVLGIVTLITIWFTINDDRVDEAVEPQVQYSVPVITDSIETKNVIAIVDSLQIQQENSAIIKDTNNFEKKHIATTITEATTTKVSETKSVEKENEVLKIKAELTASQITKLKLAKYLNFSDGQTINLDSGKHLLCFFSATCKHCQDAYKDICELQKAGGLPEVRLYLYGLEFQEYSFLNLASDCRPPFIRTENLTEFNRMLEGKGFPKILAFEEGEILKEWNADTYSKDSMKDFFGIKEVDKAPLIKKSQNNMEWGNEKNNPWDF